MSDEPSWPETPWYRRTKQQRRAVFRAAETVRKAKYAASKETHRAAALDQSATPEARVAEIKAYRAAAGDERRNANEARREAERVRRESE